jgi:hypothetical protein
MNFPHGFSVLKNGNGLKKQWSKQRSPLALLFAAVKHSF